jgi:hypothetical protein
MKSHPSSIRRYIVVMLLLLAACTGLKPDPHPTGTPRLPDRVTSLEFLELYREWSVEAHPRSDPPQVIDIFELTTDEIWQGIGGQIFTLKAGSTESATTLFYRGGELWELGSGWDGEGLLPHNLTTSDLDEDGKIELLYVYAADLDIERTSSIGILFFPGGAPRNLKIELHHPGDLELIKANDQNIHIFTLPGEGGQTEYLGKIILSDGRLLEVSPSHGEAHGVIAYSSEVFRVAFNIPKGWMFIEPDHYQGSCGYFRIEPYRGGAAFMEQSWHSEPAGELNLALARACSLEANKNPERFGEGMQVRMAAFDTLTERCLIIPEKKALEKDAQILFWSPAGGLAVIYTDLDHVEAINNSLEFIYGDKPPLQQRRAYASDPSQVSLLLEVETRQVRDLTLEETSLFSIDIHTPRDMETGLSEVLNRRTGFRASFEDLPIEEKIDSINAVLAPANSFVQAGDRISEGLVDLHESQKLVRKDLGLYGAASGGVDSAGKPTFALLVATQSSASGFLLIRPGVEFDWNMEDHFWVPPVLMDGRLLYLEERPGTASQVLVKLDDEILYIYRSALNIPLTVGLHVWGNHWALEVDGTLVIDGEQVNVKNEYYQAFSFGLLGGEPFYFYERNGQTGISYAGQELDVFYDEVIHGWCCQWAKMNPSINENMAWVFARRVGIWYYVEIGIY